MKMDIISFETTLILHGILININFINIYYFLKPQYITLSFIGLKFLQYQPLIFKRCM